MNILHIFVKIFIIEENENITDKYFFSYIFTKLGTYF